MNISIQRTRARDYVRTSNASIGEGRKEVEEGRRERADSGEKLKGDGWGSEENERRNRRRRRNREREKERRGKRGEGSKPVMDLIIVEPRKTRDRSEMLL